MTKELRQEELSDVFFDELIRLPIIPEFFTGDFWSTARELVHRYGEEKTIEIIRRMIETKQPVFARSHSQPR